MNCTLGCQGPHPLLLGPPQDWGLPQSRPRVAWWPFFFFPMENGGGYDDLMVEFYRMGFSWNFHGDLVEF